MPPTFFSKNVDLKLIQLVKENPVLYNPRHPKYTDSDTREVTWQKIGDALSRPAAEFAGIQCQIHYGDFQEDKHKPGFIENMKEFMPEQYATSWGVEKKVLKEYRRHQGLSQLEAKHLYTKTARALPTYGVTFFLVKEKQKDKKKLVPRLLGISAEAILRLDENTKEVLQLWPLTHVKTYHAAKGEIFTLDFGDYSKDQYSVKTRDAYRIRDILEDYIDLIRKRMLAPYNSTCTESSYITQDNISSSHANIVQHITNNPMKIVEQSFVGPSKIMTHEVGKESSRGAQIITVQQVVLSEKALHHQQGVKGEVGLRGDMSLPFTRRLNRLNSNSVKIVSLLTVPSQTHVEDARKIVEAMNADLSYVRDGVTETIEKQTSEEEKKKLQDQMNELDELMKQLSEFTAPGSTDESEIGDAAMKVADLTTQMYFSLDSKTKRRSRIISRSRPSFVEDDKTRRSMRKASFVAAATSAVHAVLGSKAVLGEEYEGPLLDPQRSAELEASAVDKLGKLNAAVAHYILAHSDPKNVDYEAAVNSMNTIHEVMPDFCKDAQALASSRPPAAKKEILLDAMSLCDSIKNICSSTSMDDREKLRAASKDYAEASGRLVFTFGKGMNSEKENEMLDLADSVGSKTSLLLMSAQQLASRAAGEPAAAVDRAGVAAAEAAEDVISQVKLCAPTIQEPHCQSAVTAAAESLSTSVQTLATTCRPLVDTPQHAADGERLHHQTMDVARALDRLKGAYSALGGEEEGDVFENPSAVQERRRLKFINTVTANKKRWTEVEDLLDEPSPTDVQAPEEAQAQSRLTQRLGQLNAAIASLLAATADRDRPDYATAELAINTINELMPQVVQDTKVASANKEPDARDVMMQHIKALCDASKGICAYSEDTSPEERQAAIAKFTNASGKLVFGISHRGNPDRENQILELTDAAVQKTSQLLAGVQQLAEAVGGERGEELDGKGVSCSDAAQALLNTAQVTAQSISEPRCQSALLSSIDKLSSSGQDLAKAWKPLHENPLHKKQVQGLDQHLEQLGERLDALRGACVAVEDVRTDAMPREQQKLQFIKSMSGAKQKIDKAQKALDKPIPPAQNIDKAEAIQLRLSGRLGELNAAIAALLSATADRDRPDYQAAEDAAKTISDLLPFVVQDSLSSCANKDAAARAAMLDLVRELCEASRAVCAGAGGNDPKELSEAASKFSDASGKMVYIVSPRANVNRENQIMGLTASACSKASELLSGVQTIAGGAGGARGQELDARGVALADAARGLMDIAKLTAPSISEPHCKQALLTSASKLSSSGRQLAQSWAPLLQEPKHQKQVEALQVPLQHMEEQLDALKKACLIPDYELKKPRPSMPFEEKKLQFGVTLSGAKEQILKAQKGLDKPLPPPLAADKAVAVQHRLSGRLGELNAAIAALLAATSNKEKPDYKAAEQAVRTITDLMPYVVQDTQSTCANKDEATRAAMLDLIRELCEASRAVCAGADSTNPQALSDALTKYSDASGKLVYVVSPRVNADREKQIDDLSAAACSKASELLAGVQTLAGAAGGARGQELDARGADVADAAQNLLATSQVTSSSISEPHCKQALLTSASKLSSSGRQLAQSWAPLLQEPKHQKQVEALQVPLQQMEGHLEELRKACDLPDGVPQSAELPAELQKLQFVKTMSAAREQIHRAQKALEKPIPPPLASDKAEAVKLRLSGRLGELNAAIAALLQATADHEKPDYKTAEAALKTITELVPTVVQDSQSSCANKDAAARAAMLDLVRELCEASRAVCAGADGTNPQGVSEAAAKLSHASGKLVYVVNPRANSDREKMIKALSAGACDKASRLLSSVQKLPTSVEGASGRELEARGQAVGAASRLLGATAQLTAPCISEPHCNRAMQASIQRLSSASRELVGAWRPLLQGYSWSTLRTPLQDLDNQLEELTHACLIPDAEIQTTDIPVEQHKLQLGLSLSAAADQIEILQRDLNKPTVPLPSPQEDVQHRLSGRLGELNAAIAALLLATSDRERPDYKSAEEAAKTILKVMPHVVQDTKSSCANKDESARAAMLDLVRELCEASRAVCAGADGTNPQALSDATSKFSEASGKLVHALNPRVDEKREKEIVSLSASACSKASELLAGVQTLAGAAGGARGQELDARGADVADAAQNLLATAKLTAPSISEPHCKQALLTSASKLSSSGRQLAQSWAPLLQEPKLHIEVLALQVPLQQMEGQLEKLRKACDVSADVKATQAAAEEQQRLQFIQSMTQARQQIQNAEKALDKPIPPPLTSDKAEVVHQRLSGRLGELNAAIAALLSATADREKPYYETADKAVKTIVDLLPHVIEDTQSASANREPASRGAVLALLRQLTAASRDVCGRADGRDPQGLSEAVGKFSDASGKLGYMVDPQDETEKNHIMQLATGVCTDTSQLLAGVQRLAGAVGGARGARLDRGGAALADAAQALLAAAQVTAPSISNPHCKSALLHPVELVSKHSQELAGTWQPCLQDPKYKQQAAALQQALQALDMQVEALRKACAQCAREKPPPAPPRAGSSTSSTSSTSRRTIDVTREFLDRLCCEEGQARSTADYTDTSKVCLRPPTVMTDDEKRLQQQFLQSAETAEKTVKKTEEGLRQASKSTSPAPAVSAGDCLSRQARLQRNIALASVEVAALVGANYGHTMDYASATRSTKELPQLMATIVEDGKLLSSTVGEQARRAFLEDLLHMCAATRGICRAASIDREKLNDAAIEFGDKSTKLLHIVSNDVDPTLEKEIITRAKAIGDGIVQISVSAGAVAAEAGAGASAGLEALCRAGADAQDGAGKLLYTAKLVAPSIYETSCQEALLKSAENLSSELRTFTSSWKPFSSDPRHAKTVKELGKEAENLERILEGLKSDVKGGRIGRRREMERLVVEDTPMRQLTLRVMEDAKKISDISDLSPALKKEYVEYSKKLSDALRVLDLANARCKRTLHDTNKRRELENAIQNLQVILLQTRPARGDSPRSNIVDLRDFIDEVSSEADKLSELTASVNVATAADKKALQHITANSEKISKAAYKLTHTDDAAGFDTSFDDILDVDVFGQECDDVIKDINVQLQSVEDAKARAALHSRILPLTESCNMLRFATKSGISASKSVSLDATLDDLDDIEARVIRSIVKEGAKDTVVTLRTTSKAVQSTASDQLILAVSAGACTSPRAPLTAYIARCAATTDISDDDTRNRLLKHLYKVVHQLKTQAGCSSQRLATWQPLDHPELRALTEQILQEIQNPESKFQPETKTKRILNESDLNKLLIPSPAKVIGDAKHQESKLNLLSTKLSSMCGALALSVASPETLSRSAHAASDAAVELSSIARGCNNQKDPVQSERIEELVQEMTFTTYGALKAAEQACLDPNNSISKRRLLDACRSLNASINNLVYTASSSSKLKKECGSMSRSLQLQQACIQNVPTPSSSLPFDQCCEALNQQQEIVYKLKNEQPMSRQEFARSLTEVNEAVCKTTEITSHCAYLMAVSEKDSDIAKKGPVDVPQIQKSIESLQDSCMAIIGSSSIQLAKEETDELHKRVQDFSRALDEAHLKVKDGGVKATLTRAKAGVATSAAGLWDSLKEGNDMEKVTPHAVSLLEEVSRAHALLERCPLTPPAPALTPDAQARCDELADNSKSLLTHTMALVKDVSAADDDSEVMTWVTFSASRTKLLDAYDALVKSIRVNGQRAGILEGSPEDEEDDLDAEHKTYLEIQVDLANKWLNRPMCKNDVKKTGQESVRNVIDIATKMSEELTGTEREELRSLASECADLLTQCTVCYDQENYSTLVERLKELKKAIQRGVVTRVVEDFIEVDDPALHLDVLVDAEEDEQKRKFLLERKIAELLAQLGRVTRTARFVAHAAGPRPAPALLACSEQTELLAPMLVQAAQERIASPDNQAVVDRYKELLAEYAASIAKVRELCDRAVDPMDFVQTAGDTMQRMREESAAQGDARGGHRTSEAIIKLANRSIEVSLSSLAVRRDPSLRAALTAARARVQAATPAASCRRSALPDWKESAAEVMRTTGEVESALGGEHIFKKQPAAQAQGSSHQIYSVARELHESVRGWSARDNDIVAAARRVAVLMARLSEHVQTDKKQALISTSKSIVIEAHEVAALARKLAHECTDVRIKTNLLQTCERIPTISAQLKMLTTVKGSSLGHQGTKEDSEAMDMLVGNAQSLMMSIQEVVKAAAGASVKIMSQRGPRLRWLRKNYY